MGDNVLFSDLEQDYKVYAFFYPGDAVNTRLESALRNLAETTGSNLFLNIGRLNDPQLDKISKRFDIRTFPVLIVTANPELASLPVELGSLFARLDEPHLFEAPYPVVDCLRELLTLFLQGKVAEAMAHAKSEQRMAKVRVIVNFLGSALAPLAKLLSKLELSFSLTEGKISVKSATDAKHE